MNRSLIVAAHPDDEVLGMAGTIARLAQQGEVGILFIGNGVGSRPHGDKELHARSEAAEEASRILGAKILETFDFPDNMLDSVPRLEIIKSIEKWKKTFLPDLVFTHHLGDLNIDHRIVGEATLTAFRPQPDEAYSEICSFEVNSSTEWSNISLGEQFCPDTYYDITPYLKKVESALECYQLEMRQFPHARSLKAVLARRVVRGAEVGVDAAEAFMTLRRILRV